ncbi:hypothetical protein DFJ58DRAFT_843345 [Suillus subalutaceus]|uniref:uncharacterized protein n=1 Tax=Suillus subalutaceus TaxID=48586 RepID=UPI001B8826F5|nr:uncharacterized protein DFJ58DRAFT_843345 [Suillus subalutaceus]KAG1847028.1 hypothetical protein DFJ58DRAFT_843345 [Suillus subalutaceus]
MQLATLALEANSEGHRNNNVILDWEWTDQGTSTYRFSTEILRGLALLLFERLKNDVPGIPNVPLTSTFPYRSANGAACFVCEVDGEARGAFHERYRCVRFPAVAFEELGPKLIEHMAGHVLFNEDLRDKRNVYGLCLSIRLCEIQLARGVGGSDPVKGHSRPIQAKTVPVCIFQPTSVTNYNEFRRIWHARMGMYKDR